MAKGKEVSGYCHDPEIIEWAREHGITDPKLINLALSKGEAVLYGDGVEKGIDFLQKAIQPKGKSRNE